MAESCQFSPCLRPATTASKVSRLVLLSSLVGKSQLGKSDDLLRASKVAKVTGGPAFGGLGNNELKNTSARLPLKGTRQNHS